MFPNKGRQNYQFKKNQHLITQMISHLPHLVRMGVTGLIDTERKGIINFGQLAKNSFKLTLYNYFIYVKYFFTKTHSHHKIIVTVTWRGEQIFLNFPEICWQLNHVPCISNLSTSRWLRIKFLSISRFPSFFWRYPLDYKTTTLYI